MVWQGDRKRRRKRKIHTPPLHIYEVGRLADGEKEKPVFDRRRGLSAAEVEKDFFGQVLFAANGIIYYFVSFFLYHLH